jgi:hypothetical protein
MLMASMMLPFIVGVSTVLLPHPLLHIPVTQLLGFQAVTSMLYLLFIILRDSCWWLVAVQGDVDGVQCWYYLRIQQHEHVQYCINAYVNPTEQFAS